MIRQDAAFTPRYRAPGSAPQGPIRYAIGQTTLGMVLAGKTELGICAILLGADRDAARRAGHRLSRCDAASGSAIAAT